VRHAVQSRQFAGRKGSQVRVFALILESLGNGELLVILVVALIFFGPRKLPQLARSIGKSLAEFRRASEDFKRTWEREVAMESARLDAQDNQIAAPNADIAYIEPSTTHEVAEPVTPEWVVPRETAADNEPSTAVAENVGETSPQKS